MAGKFLFQNTLILIAWFFLGTFQFKPEILEIWVIKENFNNN